MSINQSTTQNTTQNTIRWYFEDFQVGQEFDAGSVLVDAEELDQFARRYDPQPFHIDPEAAKDSIFGGVIAVDGFLHETASLGSPGLDQVRWLRPVRAGDRLHVIARTLSVRASQSKPDRGVVDWIWEARNQHGELVTTVTSMGLVGRRPALAINIASND